MILLSDGYVANGSEPWLLPDVDELPDLQVEFATEPNGEDGQTFLPYLRDPETLARPWAIPGTPGLEHRIGGLEKADKTGDISYDPANHDFMVRTRAARIEGIEVPDVEVEDPDGDGPGAGARLGLDVRADRRGLPGAAPARPADRPGPPAAPRRRCRRNLGEVLAVVRQGGHPGDEPGPAGARHPGAGTWSTRSPTTRSAACRSPPPSWRSMLEDVVKNVLSPIAAEADRQGLQVRPGGALVPRLR